MREINNKNNRREQELDQALSTKCSLYNGYVWVFGSFK